LEIAQLYVYLIKQEKILSQKKLITSNERAFPKRYNEVFYFLFLLKQDPLAAYSELRKMIVESNILLGKLSTGFKTDQKDYIVVLEKILGLLEKTKLMQDSFGKMINPLAERVEEKHHKHSHKTRSHTKKVKRKTPKRK